MSYKSLLLKRAKDELAEAWSWYEDRLTGLGDRFEEEVYKRIHQTELTPDRYPEKKKPYRETLIKVFPCLLIIVLKRRTNYS